jgi:hypothetical protein
MPTYEVEQYELHTMTYRVEAANVAEAIKKLLSGDAEAIDGGLEFIEVADDFGMPVDEERDLADALRSLDVAVGDDVIPSIRSVQQMG